MTVQSNGPISINYDDKMMKRSTEDQQTLSASLYETTRLKDLEVRFDWKDKVTK